MLGDSLLVVPKLRKSIDPNKDVNNRKTLNDKVYPVNLYLVEKDSDNNPLYWFNF